MTKAATSKGNSKSFKYNPHATPSSSTCKVTPGMQGFMITTGRGKERAAAFELVKFFPEYLKVLYPSLEPHTDNNDDDDEGDIEDAFNKELNELKGGDGVQKTKKLFRALDIGISCCYFIQALPPVNATPFIHHVLTDINISKIKNSRFVKRVIPLQATCYANVADLTALLQKLLPTYFAPSCNIEDKKIKFSIIPSIRNNSNLKRDRVIQLTAGIVEEINKEGVEVDLSNPDLCIIVEVFRMMCGVSVVEDYNKLKKYNLEQVCEKEQVKEKDEKHEDVVEEE